MTTREPPAFYVGYLPVPRAVLRFVRALVPVVLWMLVLAAWAISRSQPDPGPAVWNSAQAQTFSGTLIATPYPALLVDEPGATPRVHLLLELGKHGVTRDFVPLLNTRVRVSGWTLDRDGRRIIELEPDPAALSPAQTEAPAFPPNWQTVGAVSLRGEIVDTKCFMGAMKPGTGRTHRACAILCLQGGIPPSLVSRSPSGEPTFTMLCGPAAEPLTGPALDALLDHVAAPVQLEGTLEEFAGQRRLRLAPGSIRPR